MLSTYFVNSVLFVPCVLGLLLHLIPVNYKYGQITMDEDVESASENESQDLLPVSKNGTSKKSHDSPKASIELEAVEKDEQCN